VVSEERKKKKGVCEWGEKKKKCVGKKKGKGEKGKKKVCV
jgi:hypothetical protein